MLDRVLNTALNYVSKIPVGNCMFKFNNRNTRTRCEICSKSTIKTQERRLVSFWCLYCWLWTDFTPCYSVSIVNFEQVNAGWVIRRWIFNLQISLQWIIWCWQFGWRKGLVPPSTVKTMSLREKRPYSALFWSAYSYIWCQFVLFHC